jgi:hypothetical protein
MVVDEKWISIGDTHEKAPRINEGLLEVLLTSQIQHLLEHLQQLEIQVIRELCTYQPF